MIESIFAASEKYYFYAKRVDIIISDIDIYC